ncbi:MAG: hypothetical protein M1467_08635 [Deltaproteobacteria bacterium]|nr:hypothetical protein [Deltaproteobacteria bacterium]
MQLTFDNFINNFPILITDQKTIDLTEAEWIEPIWYSIIKAYDELCKTQGHNLNIIKPIKTNVASYFDTINYGTHRYRSTYVPISIVSNSTENNKISKEIVEKIMLHNDFNKLSEENKKDTKDYLEYMISELQNNVIQHSGSLFGAITCAQYFPTLNKIQVSIADCGFGFLASLQKTCELNSEIKALRKSLEQGVTGSHPVGTYSSNNNVGYGLYVLKNIIQRNKAKMLMISRNGSILLENGQILSYELDRDIMGSIVAFEIYNIKFDYFLDEFFNYFIYPDENND